MRSFASILNDDELTDLSEQYTSIQWRGDDEEVEEEEPESDVEEGHQPASPTPVSTEAVLVVESEAAEESESTEEISDDTSSAATTAN